MGDVTVVPVGGTVRVWSVGVLAFVEEGRIGVRCGLVDAVARLSLATFASREGDHLMLPGVRR